MSLECGGTKETGLGAAPAGLTGEKEFCSVCGGWDLHFLLFYLALLIPRGNDFLHSQGCVCGNGLYFLF